ncbi:MAG: hypothetical protein ACT4TC_15770 [Myxococcaceae bacterium]
MVRLRAVVLVLASVCSAANAAEITRIASSFEEKDPFGLFIDVAFERTTSRGKIVHEVHQDGDVQDANELRYVGVDTRLNLEAHIGIWQDFELSFGVPIVFAQDRRWGFNQSGGATDASNSSITNNCVRINGDIVPNCPGTNREPIFAVDDSTRSYRGGIGNLKIGLAYGILNQAKDETKPTWIVGIDYEAPTATKLDPTLPTAENARGNIGDRIHKYKLYTSLSRRMGAADPYFSLSYQLPMKGSGWYSNCDNPDPRYLGRPENCSNGAWSRADTGIKPPHEVGLRFGTELVMFEKPKAGQRVAIDLRGVVTYVSGGRYYNEMSDLFGRFLSTSDYASIGGRFGFVAHLAEFVRLRLGLQYTYNTERVLTNELIGKDLDAPGSPGYGTVEVKTNLAEINPTFDWRADMTSRRFRMVDSNTFMIDAALTFSF